MYGWQVKLCDPSLTRAKLRASEMSIAHTVKRYINVMFTCLLTSFYASTDLYVYRPLVQRVGSGIDDRWKQADELEIEGLVQPMRHVVQQNAFGEIQSGVAVIV